MKGGIKTLIPTLASSFELFIAFLISNHIFEFNVAGKLLIMSKVSGICDGKRNGVD